MEEAVEKHECNCTILLGDENGNWIAKKVKEINNIKPSNPTHLNKETHESDNRAE